MRLKNINKSIQKEKHMEERTMQLVMISGLPGKMATLIQNKLPKDRYEQVPFMLTGEREKSDILPFGFYPPSQRNVLVAELAKYPSRSIIAIDFTLPDTVEENVRFYCDNNIPFVMGTTGGKREILPKLVEASEISAVIATNMSAPIVMLINMFEFAAANYPGVLENWEIRIVESHQSGKKDVSGTAMTIGKIVQGLGVNFVGEKNIRSVRRDDIEQLLMGIPDFALSGHGWHKYSLVSPDRKVTLGFEHNINGRDTYVDGTIMALDFLTKKVAEGVKGKYFSMIEVMQG